MKNNLLNYHGSKIEELNFFPENQAKFEAIFSLGNCYLGLRAVTEEDNLYRQYGLFIGGTFNSVSGQEVPELPNGADILNMEFKINNVQFNLTKGRVSHYKRSFDYSQATLTREFIWTYEEFKIQFKFLTFLSWENVHLVSQQVELTSLNGSIDLKFSSGIFANTTNNGINHFDDIDSQFNQEVQQYHLQTIQSKIDFYYSRSFKFFINNKQVMKPENELVSLNGTNRRKIYQVFDFHLAENEELKIEAYSLVNTSIDFDFIPAIDFLRTQLNNMNVIKKTEFIKLFEQHKGVYQKQFHDFGLELKSKNSEDQTKLKATIYHLMKFSPRFDSRLNIDPTGWTGQEFKGHTLWISEIYLLPFYIYSNPVLAKHLLKQRYFMKKSAHLKAKENNFSGAMWPWESSWANDGETHYYWKEVDFNTGNRKLSQIPVTSLHVGLNIMWAIWLYFKQTNDNEFMERYGYEMLFDTAIFWTNRTTKNSKNEFEIWNVTGINSYQQETNNNFYTNFMLKEMLQFCNEIYEDLLKNQTVLLAKLDKKIKIRSYIIQIRELIRSLVIPNNKAGIIPENNDFFKLKELERIKFYQANIADFKTKFNFKDLQNYQIVDQSDIISLFYTLGYKFDENTILKNWNYYFNRTVNPSNLAYSMYATISARIGKTDLAYELFQKALDVDFNLNLNSSINAGNIGGIIKTLVEGFAGVQNIGTGLCLNPHLPEEIEVIKFPLIYQQQKFDVQVFPTVVKIKRVKGNKPVTILVNNLVCELPIDKKMLEINYGGVYYEVAKTSQFEVNHD